MFARARLGLALGRFAATAASPHHPSPPPLTPRPTSPSPRSAYGDDFYAALPDTPADFTKMVYYKDIFVGVVACRLEPQPEGAPAGKRLYVMVLAVLAPYRDRGLGSLLLQQVVAAVEGGKVKGAEDVREIYCHVWEQNAGAQRLYERFGFMADKERVMNYYKRLENPHAVTLRRAVGGGGGGGGGGSS